MKLSEIAPGTIVENSDRRIEYLGQNGICYVGKIISTEFSWEKPGEICESFTGTYDGWKIVNLEENSIKHFKKKIEETKSELVRLETTLKGLEDSKRMKELTETLSNLIVGDFYTVKLGSAFWFTGIYSGGISLERLMFKRIDGNNTSETIYKNSIKQIIHRPNFSNDYRNLLKKIDLYNSELENVK